jgi:hypothetical protein
MILFPFLWWVLGFPIGSIIGVEVAYVNNQRNLFFRLVILYGIGHIGHPKPERGILARLPYEVGFVADREYIALA